MGVEVGEEGRVKRDGRKRKESAGRYPWENATKREKIKKIDIQNKTEQEQKESESTRIANERRENPHTTIASHSVPRACSRQLARSEELESPQLHPSFDFEVLPLYLQAFLFSFVQHGPKMCVLVRCRLGLVAPQMRVEEIVDRLADKLSFFEWLG